MNSGSSRPAPGSETPEGPRGAADQRQTGAGALLWAYATDFPSETTLHGQGSLPELLGVNLADLIADSTFVGRRIIELDRGARDNLRRELASVGAGTADYRIIGHDGRERLVREAAQVFTVGGQRICSGTISDLALASAQRDEASAFRQAVDCARDGFALTDASGCYVYLNDEHVRLFGYRSAGELLGRSWRDMYDPEWARRVEQEALPAIGAKGYWHGQMMARRRDGSSFHEELTLSLLPGGGIVCTCRDRSLEVEMAGRLRNSESLFRQFLNSLPDGVVIRRWDGDYEFANEAMARFLGLSVGEIVGRQQLQNGPHEVLERLRKLDANVAATGRPSEVEIPLTWRDRSYVIDVVKLPLRLGSDQVTHICTIAHDATQQRSLEREAHEVSERRRGYVEMQREFIALVSHELRTPLTAIQGAHFLIGRHLAKLPSESTANVSRLLRLQEDALKILRNLVDQVLLLNRIDHSASTVRELTPGDVGAVIAKVVGTFNESMPEARVEFAATVPPDFTVRLDESMIRAAIENLVSNGLKYSPSEKKVRVELAATATGWEIGVSDEGRGMPEAEQAKLFQPFFRASNAGNVPGTGLGLTIVRKVVDMHGGQIDFRSREGAGTTVRLCFPHITGSSNS